MEATNETPARNLEECRDRMLAVATTLAFLRAESAALMMEFHVAMKLDPAAAFELVNPLPERVQRLFQAIEALGIELNQ